VGRPARLTRTAIVDAAAALVVRGGPEALTMKALGSALAVDPSAVYRHVADKDELLRAVGDRLLEGVADGLPGERAWDDVVRTTCRRLRAALLAEPALAALTRDAPTRQPNELRLTETLLGALRDGGFAPAAAAAGYHALIELTVGAAAIDGTLAARPAAERRATYAAWRRAYRRLPARAFPASRVAAPFLYRGSADERFAFTIDALLDGLMATVARR
jgi:AcrR family transcriptional regulator